ncbi:MAG: GNAT family acetyltransferase [Methylococcus sp.]|nr:GNAT family acetyltransferase [Methylococcus sp.]
MSNNVSIQPYNDESHKSGIIELWNIAFNNPTDHNAPELSIAKKQAVNDGLLFVAVRKDQVIGSIMAGYDGHRGWLYSVAVLPDQRKLGVGAALVAHAEKALTNKGCKKINLQIVAGNAQVVGFYEAIGYTQEPRISMGKLIDA